MITKFSWRRAVAVPAVLTLALGGALLSTTAAQAVDSDLIVTSPTAASTTDSRLVTVAGTAIADANVIIKDTDTDGAVLARTTTDATGAFSTTIQYPDTAIVAQTIFVDGEKGFSGFDPTVTRSFSLPAVAPVEVFAVTTPEVGQQLASRTVTFSGTGISGSTVNVLGTDGNRLPGTGAVAVVGGQWSLQYTYPETVDRNQSVRVTQVTGGSGTGDAPVAFVLPQGQTLVVETPAADTTTATRTVTFSGTGTSGSTVNVLGADGNRLPGTGAIVVIDGRWTLDYTYPDDATVAQSVRVTQVTGGAGSGDVPRSFNLPAVVVPPTDVVLDAPVITSPTQGQVVVGDQVTFEGTGTPGSNILLAVVPTDQLDELEAAENGRAAAAAVPADPADPIVVDAAGNWTVTLALTPNDYTAAAVSFLLDADGLPVLDAAGQPIVSDPSADVAFSLVAAVTPAALPATPIATGTTGLAYTGSEGTEAAIGIGAAVLLLGSTLMVLARRRAKLATTDVAGE
ncbi:MULTISPECIES: hypothetical protein [unclassified Frigoribacterium]|uniref:hypothetical protein n=1 Tax=unclassified Frigoribacterium TaxID=2627005 RepID=UPI0006F286E1|nr:MULTISPECIES: hypothetical protein [unclassified Frigoribacterium]KQM25446.1 hypothetical protein ASL10_07715 [Frigoribacterium sp. Leaf8]MBD8485220.1 hypothetical protein [Frigoribacterium sp. CFBP 8759]WAC50866.1 hypothetical protein OVA02_13475 [Frigoribacterium sp. SL97]